MQVFVYLVINFKWHEHKYLWRKNNRMARSRDIKECVRTDIRYHYVDSIVHVYVQKLTA